MVFLHSKPMQLFCAYAQRNAANKQGNIMLTAYNPVQTMSSREIAELTEKQHGHVMRDISVMLQELNAFEDGYIQTWRHPQNGQEYKQFCLPKDLTLTLISGYNVKLRKRIVDRWMELEASHEPSIPQTYAEALRLAADQAEQIEQQQLLIEQQRPAVEFVERYVEAKSSKSLSDVAKVLGHKPRAFIALLADDGVIFKRGGSWIPFQQHVDAGRFSVHTGESNGHAFLQARVEPKGVEWLARKYGDKQ